MIAIRIGPIDGRPCRTAPWGNDPAAADFGCDSKSPSAPTGQSEFFDGSDFGSWEIQTGGNEGDEEVY